MMDFETMLAQWRVEEPPIAHAWGPELTSLSDLTAAYPGVPWQDLFEKIAEDCRSFKDKAASAKKAKMKSLILRLYPLNSKKRFLTLQTTKTSKLESQQLIVCMKLFLKPATMRTRRH
jgi:hypothetical protein